VTVGARTLDWDGCHNVRDLGGLPLAAGGETRYGVVVRADSLCRLTAAGWAQALDYGVRRLVDLRFDIEIARDREAVPPVEVVHVSLFGPHDPRKDREWEANTRSASDLTAVYTDLYVKAIDQRSTEIARVVNAVADNGACIAVHCFAGKDRTGIVAALLLSLAGVEDADILEDFTASDQGVLRLCADWIESAEDDAERLYRTRVVIAPGAAMAAMLDHVTERWGGAERYLLAHGVEPDALDALRVRLAGRA